MLNRMCNGSAYQTLRADARYRFNANTHAGFGRIALYLRQAEIFLSLLLIAKAYFLKILLKLLLQEFQHV